MHPGADGACRHRDGARLFGGLERLSADGLDRSDHAFPASGHVVADARVVRIGRNTSFGRVMLLNAADRRPVGMVANAYSMV